METAYEAIYVVETNLPEEQVNAIVDKYTGVVTRGGGVVDDIDRWEPRRLAFEVKGRREGVYFVMNFRSEAAAKDELDRIFRISDDVLRHMVIKQDEHADRFPSRARAAESERREREMAARTAVAPAPEPVTELSATPPAAEPAPAEEAPAARTEEAAEAAPAAEEREPTGAPA
jgi:small subunit ribosomal protein S6